MVKATLNEASDVTQDKDVEIEVVDSTQIKVTVDGETATVDSA